VWVRDEIADLLESNDRTTGDVMTITQAAELRVKWQQRVDPLPCEHLNLEMEWSDNGYATGSYNCIVCGEAVVHKHK
jgi:hypothetical protein